MGQYHQLVNFTKHERINPHAIGLGLKQFEHLHTVASLSDVLYMLLTTSPARGGGDLAVDDEFETAFRTWGRWVGDQVAVVGDYTEVADLEPLGGRFEHRRALHAAVLDPNKTLYRMTDISQSIIPAFQLAFDVKIQANAHGWAEREHTSEWDWLFVPRTSPRVEISVLGGVADVVSAPDWVDVEIIDYDNLDDYPGELVGSNNTNGGHHE